MRRLPKQQRGADVDRQHQVEVPRQQIQQREAVDRAGIADQRVQPAQRRDRGRDQLAGHVRFGQVGDTDFDGGAGGPHLGRDLRQPLAVAVDQEQRAVRIAGQQPGGSLADAACGPGDDGSHCAVLPLAASPRQTNGAARRQTPTVG